MLHVRICARICTFVEHYVLCYAGVEFIGTPIKGQADQRLQSMNSLSSSPTATAPRSLIQSVPQQGPSSNNLPHSIPNVEPELPAPISVEKQSPAKSTKSNTLSADVAPVAGDLVERKIQSTKGTGATRVHLKATVTSEENKEDEVDDEEDGEEEEEDDGEEGEEVEGMDEGGRPKKGSHKKAAAKRKSVVADRAGKRSKAVEGSKAKIKSDGAPKHPNAVVNAAKRKKTPVVDRISKASNTRAGKAQSSK